MPTLRHGVATRRVSAYGGHERVMAAVVQHPLFEERVGRAMNKAAHGPAGLSRLTGMIGGAMNPQGASRLSRTGDTAEIGAARTSGRTHAAASDIGLTHVLAPEAMLHGVTGLATLDAEEAGVASGGDQIRGQQRPKRSRSMRTTEFIALRNRTSRRKRPHGTQRGAQAVDRGLQPQVIGRILNRLEQRQDSTVVSRADSADFALAWLRRVDGQLSGIDTGLEQTTESLSSYFGALADGLGSFPLATGHYRPATDSQDSSVRYSEFDWVW